MVAGAADQSRAGDQQPVAERGSARPPVAPVEDWVLRVLVGLLALGSPT